MSRRRVALQLFNRRHFVCTVRCGYLDLSNVPMFAIYTFGPGMRRVTRLGTEWRALVSMVIASFYAGLYTGVFWLAVLAVALCLLTLRHDDYRAVALLGLVSNLGIILVVVAFALYRLLFRRTGHTAMAFI